jgi:ribosome-associated translation inhibitor RaiA
MSNSPTELPIRITFRNMDPSPTLEGKIREKAAKLERFHGRVTDCRISVEAPHRHHQKGQLYKVSIDLSLPGHEILATSGTGDNHAHEDPYVDVRDAFDAAARQLEDTLHRQRDARHGHGGPRPRT